MNQTTERPSRQSAHLARQRILFIHAAQRALAASGLNATIEEFAAEAGVTVATLYNHFPSKDALIRLAFRQAIEDWEESMLATVASIDDPAERLVASFRLFLRAPQSHSDFAKLASIASTAGAPIILATAEGAIRQIDQINLDRGITLTIPRKRFQSFLAGLLAEIQQQSLASDESAADGVVELLLPLLGFSAEESHQLVSRKLPAY
jgi:AcrR family transcriptional regulator